MRYRITHTTKYAYSNPVPVCHNKVHLRPRNSARQSCQKFQLIVLPEPIAIELQFDYFDNSVDYFSLADSHRGLSITAISEVTVTEAKRDGPAITGPAWEDVVAEIWSRPPTAPINDCLFAFNSDYITPSAALAD